MPEQNHRTPLPVVVLVSGNGSNLQAIIDSIRENKINANIELVISNNADAYALERAKKADIPVQVVQQQDYPDRAAFDGEIQRLIDGVPEALVVLAGFMRILTDDFVKHFSGRMLNIHPSLLPKYKGLNTHERVVQAGEPEHGASVHFVTPALDDGPVIAQAKIRVEPGDNAETLKQKVHALEHVIYPAVIGWFADGLVRMDTDTGEVLCNGMPISEEQKLIEVASC